RAGLDRTEAKTTSILAHASAANEQFVVSIVGAYGWSKFDVSREIESLSRTARSSHTGEVWSLGAKVSAPLAYRGSAVVAPYVALDMQRAAINGYTETGAGSIGLAVRERKDENSAVEAGASMRVPL